MELDEAIMQMELIGHEFYMFKNAQSNNISVVYKRKNGGYGLLEPNE
jgi:putative sigma-54 modulation protein